jgi:hypothetical protein
MHIEVTSWQWGCSCLLICLSYQVGPLWELLITSQFQSRSHGDHLSFRPSVPLELSQFWTLNFPSTKTGQKLSKPPKDSPLACLLQNLQVLRLTKAIKPKWLIFYCNTIWPQYKLNNSNHWPKQDFQFPNSAQSQKLDAMGHDLRSP